MSEAVIQSPVRSRLIAAWPYVIRWAGAILGALVIFGALVAFKGANPLEVYADMWHSTFARPR